MSKLAYYRRIFSAYLTGRNSHLTFWHGTPEVNDRAPVDRVGEYHMPFRGKADYPGPFDEGGIPLLDYRGEVGVQYNPIAIAQYGLGNFNLHVRGEDPEGERRARFLRVSDWLVDNLEENPGGLPVWNHHFDWEYRTPLEAPWYSALAQGQGISVLVRAALETGDEVYADAADEAFRAFLAETDEGGVTVRDEDGFVWFEETIVDPPTHILNGFIWASWGVRDYAFFRESPRAEELFGEAVRTLRDNLHRFDTGYWSLYEEPGTRLRMLASPFYHRLHIVQLRVMHRLTGVAVFREFADAWEEYARSPFNRLRALVHKAIFKLIHY